MRFYFSLLIAGLVQSVSGQTTSLTGYVRDDQSLRGVPGAEVSVDGVDRKVKTEKDGKYVVKDVPYGPRVVHVRLLGFAPVDTVLQFSEGKATENVFFVSRAAVALDSVVTNANRRAAGVGFESFGDRRAKGFGAFFDSLELKQHAEQHLPDLLGGGVKGIDVMRPTICGLTRPLLCSWRVAVKQDASQTTCAFQVVLDGTVIQRAHEFDDRGAPPFATPAVVAKIDDAREAEWSKLYDLNNIAIGNLMGIEVYRSGAEAPDVYGGSGTRCGVLVLWSRR